MFHSDPVRDFEIREANLADAQDRIDAEARFCGPPDEPDTTKQSAPSPPDEGSPEGGADLVDEPTA